MGRGPNQETDLCAISHLITWLNRYLGHLWPVQPHLWHRRGPKYDPFAGKNRLLWQASYKVGYFIWKVFSAPYHILIHDKTLLGAIHDLSSHLYGVGGVQNMAILGVKTRLLWRACYGARTQPGNCLCAISHLIIWLNMYLSHFWPVHVHLWRSGGPK